MERALVFTGSLQNRPIPVISYSSSWLSLPVRLVQLNSFSAMCPTRSLRQAGCISPLRVYCAHLSILKSTRSTQLNCSELVSLYFNIVAITLQQQLQLSGNSFIDATSTVFKSRRDINLFLMGWEHMQTQKKNSKPQTNRTILRYNKYSPN